MAETPDDRGHREASPQVTLFPETGYGVIRNPESRSALIFDCGPLGPDYQPGHGHCDVLSYELSLQGQRVVVDTGVSTYEPGPERSYERSTAAHNTLRIDGEEQAEIWASFRVGRRPRVGQMRGGSNGGFPFLSGEHDAYRRLGVVHARTILLLPPDTWIVVDLLSGTGSHLRRVFPAFPSPGSRRTWNCAETTHWPAPSPLDGGICRPVLLARDLRRRPVRPSPELVCGTIRRSPTFHSASLGMAGDHSCGDDSCLCPGGRFPSPPCGGLVWEID